MSAIGTTKSLDALSASLNRALAGVRAPQVAAARRAQLRRAGSSSTSSSSTAAAAPSSTVDRSAAKTDVLAARRRTNLLIGTLDRLRHPSAGWRASRGSRSG